MLCEVCKKAFRYVLDFPHYHKQGHSWIEDLILLHSSSRSFYRSIVSKCLVCRRTWIGMVSWHQKHYSNNASFKPIAFKSSSVPKTFREFKRRWFGLYATYQHALRARKDPRAQVISRQRWRSRPGLICFSIGHIDGHDYLHICPGRDEWGWSVEFHLDLVPDSLRSPCHLKDLGTSTASAPDLWLSWLMTCEKYDGHSRGIHEGDFLPKRLIEISPSHGSECSKWRLILPQSPHVLRYATLSHCWGQSSHLKLTTETRSAFLAGLDWSVLPKTYLDAFSVALALGLKHIWIDSLCIIQDDRGDWMEQAPTMASVYANGVCNIGANWALNGDQGCFRRRDPCLIEYTTVSTSPRNGQCRTYEIGSSLMYNDDILKAPLNARAWVVQERCLAKRQLSFSKDQVYWECSRHVACEQFPHGLPMSTWRMPYTFGTAPPSLKPSLLDLMQKRSFTFAWWSIAESYSSCSLTDPSDKVMALTGLAEAYRMMTRDTYLAGHWGTDLETQLCWALEHEIEPVTCRRTMGCDVPTWSWISVDSPIFADKRLRRNFRSTSYAHVLDVSIDSKSPSGLYGFVSGQLRIKGLAMVGRVHSPDENLKHYKVRLLNINEPEFQRSMNSCDIETTWDEQLSLADLATHPTEWNRLQREREDDLLLLFMFGCSHTWVWEHDIGEGPIQGLILRRCADAEEVFHRMGLFGIWDHETSAFFELLARRLELQLPRPFGKAIDLR